VHLKVGVTDGLRRTGMSTARPLLAGVNPRATFKALLEARAPLYREVASVEVDTDRRSANQVVRAVLEAIGLQVASPPPDPADPLDRPTPRDPRRTASLPDPTVGRPSG
jgi:shikimate kinase